VYTVRRTFYKHTLRTYAVRSTNIMRVTYVVRPLNTSMTAVVHAHRGPVPELAARPSQLTGIYLDVRHHAAKGQRLPADATPHRGATRQVCARTLWRGPGRVGCRHRRKQGPATPPGVHHERHLGRAVWNVWQAPPVLRGHLQFLQTVWPSHAQPHGVRRRGARCWRGYVIRFMCVVRFVITCTLSVRHACSVRRT
jgi:hypothetical protein